MKVSNPLKILSILLFLIYSNMLFGQKYDLNVGVRWGGNFGISISERIGNKLTLEQNFNSEDLSNYYSVFALVKYHHPLITKRFNWFYGGGPGIVRIKETSDYPESTKFSVALQTGLEHTIRRMTIYIALEPYSYISNSNIRFKMYKTFAIKYVFIKRKAKWKKKLKSVFSKKKHKKKSKKKPWWKIWKK